MISEVQIIEIAQQLLDSPHRTHLLLSRSGTAPIRIAMWLHRLLSERSTPSWWEAAQIGWIRGLAGQELETSRFERSTCWPLELPFRAPHYSVSLQGLTGRWSKQRCAVPGELSLAHGGVLLLDQTASFSRMALEAVSEVHAAQQIRLSSEQTFRLPASFRLVLTVDRSVDSDYRRIMGFDWDACQETNLED